MSSSMSNVYGLASQMQGLTAPGTEYRVILIQLLRAREKYIRVERSNVYCSQNLPGCQQAEFGYEEPLQLTLCWFLETLR